ncbi:MAG: hypothetical protein Q8K81_09690 [Sulfuricurvum sp.]|nr:hypothetical protein [Sulfuricurvum sp.]
MTECSIIANHKSEERYSKLSLAYSTPEEKQQIENAIHNCSCDCSIPPIIYSGDINEGKKMITIEYHDDCNREGGAVFEKILHCLGIKECR